MCVCVCAQGVSGRSNSENGCIMQQHGEGRDGSGEEHHVHTPGIITIFKIPLTVRARADPTVGVGKATGLRVYDSWRLRARSEKGFFPSFSVNCLAIHYTTLHYVILSDNWAKISALMGPSRPDRAREWPRGTHQKSSFSGGLQLRLDKRP